MSNRKVIWFFAVILLIASLIFVAAQTQDSTNLEKILSSKEPVQNNLGSFINLEDSNKVTFTISKTQKEIALKEVKNNIKNGQVNVIIWLKDDANVAAVLAKLEPDFQVIREYINFKGAAGTITSIGIDKAIKNKDVDYIVFDAPVQAHLAESRVLINVPPVEAPPYSLTGNNVGVCVLDTGINYNHPNLAAAYVGGYDFVNGDSDPMDDNGHGTKVAGVIASNHSTNKGMAQNANIAAVKVLGSSGSGQISDVATGIDWCITNKNLYNLKVVSMSLGGTGVAWTPATNPAYIEPALLNAYNNNIAIVAASGNDGFTTGIAYPAISPFVISTGATYDANIGSYPWNVNGFSCADTTTSADKVTCYGNRASFLNIMAPGTMILTTSPPNPPFFFTSSSGTSFAAPHVSGVIALMLEKNSQLTPAQIKEILVNSSSRSLPDPLSGGATWPRVNALDAVQKVPYVNHAGFLGANQQINYSINAPMHPNEAYIFLLSGGTDGVTLPDGRVFPLTYDWLLDATLVDPIGSVGLLNSVGVLDANGHAQATITIPYIPGLPYPSVDVWGAFATINGSQIDDVSNADVI